MNNQIKYKRGYFGIGIINTKTEMNVGTLWRSAYQLGADLIFTIGARYKQQASDTTNTWKHIPFFNYLTYEEFKNGIPYDCQIICIEFNENSIPLKSFNHPERCVYLLGAEDNGIPKKILGDKKVVHIESIRTQSYNVAVAGSLIMYSRFLQRNRLDLEGME